MGKERKLMKNRTKANEPTCNKCGRKSKTQVNGGVCTTCSGKKKGRKPKKKKKPRAGEMRIIGVDFDKNVHPDVVTQFRASYVALFTSKDYRYIVNSGAIS